MRSKNPERRKAIFFFLVFALASANAAAEGRKVRIGFPLIPGIFEIDKAGRRSGYFLELQEALAKKLGWRIEYVDKPWKSCLTMLDSGEIDLLGFIGRDFTGDRLFDYNREGVIATWGSLLLQATVPYSGIESLHGRTIALVSSMNETNEFLRLVRAANTTVIPVYSEAIDAQLQGFLQKKADGIVLPSNLVVDLLKKGHYIDTHIVFAPQSHGFAVKTGTNADLLTGIDLGLREMKDTSPEFLRKLKERYFEPPKTYSVPLWLMVILFFLVLTGVISLIFIAALRYQVRKHTFTLTRQRDELQRLTLEAEHVNRELESFSYSVSHDLRAPLRAIEGYSHFLVEKHGPQLDVDARNLVAKIRSSTLRMNELIESLLNLSHIGKATLDFRTVDMHAIVVSTLSEAAGEEILQSFEIRLGNLPEAWGDATLLRQVWFNLVSNAFKYSSKSAVRKIEIGGKAEVSECRYWIKDSGAGFDPAYADKLFGVFQRLHSASEFPGTGVGLALVQSIVHRHGGEVRAEGQVGKGAAFYFSIPVKPRVGTPSRLPAGSGLFPGK